MKKNKLIIVISILVISVIGVVSALVGSVYFSEKVSDKINVLGYKQSEESNPNGYQITKYDNVECAAWIDNDNILSLIDNGYYHNPDQNIDMSILSTYNLNSKEKKEFSNVIMNSRELQGISPSEKYVLYGEPRKIAAVGSAEWEEAANNQQLFHEKRDILNLETGEITEDFDKIVNNCSADYIWMDGDLIFVDYGGEWAILDKQGKWLKRGTFKFDNTASPYTRLIDVDEIEVTDEGISGCFYYTKDFWGNNKNLESRLFSMDVNTLEEKLIYKADNALNYSKHGDVFTFEDYNNNGEITEDGTYPNRTFGFKVINKDGTLLQEVGFPEGRSYGSLTLAPNGKKCVYIETEDIGKLDDAKKYSTDSDVLKVMDIKTGEVKEIAKVSDLVDNDNEEEFIKRDNIIGLNGEVKTLKSPGPIISNIQWNKTGDSLTFNYEYTSKKDGENYINTYVVTFYR